MDMSMIKSVIHSIFQDSGKSMLAKGDIISRAKDLPMAQQILPFLKQLPEKKYDEQSAAQETQNVVQSQGSSGILGKIRGKVGV